MSNQEEQNKKHLSDLEKQKKELEVNKLEEEIKQIRINNSELSKKWYKRPQWIMALSPIIVGVLTLTVAWASGFLQAQNSLNKIQEEKFERKKDSINKAISKLILSKDSVKQILDSLMIDKTSLDTAYQELKRQNFALNEIRDSLKSKSFSESKKVEFIRKGYVALQDSLKLYKTLAATYKLKWSIEKTGNLLERMKQRGLLNKIQIDEMLRRLKSADSLYYLKLAKEYAWELAAEAHY